VNNQAGEAAMGTPPMKDRQKNRGSATFEALPPFPPTKSLAD